MTQPVGGQFVAAHGPDEPRHLPGAPAHQRAFQRHQPQTVQKTGGNAHHVFGGGAHLIAQQVVAVVKPDQVAGKLLHQSLFHLLVIAVDDHAVGHAAVKFLHMARPQPNRHRIGVIQIFPGHLTEPLAGADLQTLHAQHKGLAARGHGP